MLLGLDVDVEVRAQCQVGRLAGRSLNMIGIVQPAPILLQDPCVSAVGASLWS